MAPGNNNGLDETIFASCAFYLCHSHPNIWPADDVLPELAPAFKELGQLVVRVGVLLARQVLVGSWEPSSPASNLLHAHTLLPLSKVRRGGPESSRPRGRRRACEHGASAT